VAPGDQEEGGDVHLTTIVVETVIAAPPEVCFDLALDVGAHAESAAFSGERIVEPGRLSGVLQLGDLVTFEGKHFGIRQRFTTKIVEIDPFPHGTLEDCRSEVENVTVEDSVLDYVVRIAAESRRSPDLILGASPRAGVHLLRAAKTAAAIEGRDFVTPDDVKSLAIPTLRHRIVLRAEAEIEGLDADAVCKRVLARLDVPR